MEINIGIEFKYVVILLELEAFGKFLDRLEKGLKYLSDQEELRNSSSLRNLYDLNDIQNSNYDLTELVEHILPRFFRNPALISLYAIYESSVNIIADYLRQKLDESLPRLKNYEKNKRMNFLHRANKYFHDVLKIPLYSNGYEEDLERLRVLTNAIAHCNGRLEEVKTMERKTIQKWEKDKIGISIYQGDLLISEGFLRKTYLIVKDSLSDLIKSHKTVSIKALSSALQGLPFIGNV